MTILALALSLFALHGFAVPPGTAIHQQVCPDGGRSCSVPGTHDVWLSPGWTPRVLFHELGHQVDYWQLTDTVRIQFEGMLGDSRPWDAVPNSPREQWAEAFSLCAAGRGQPTFGGRVMGGYAYTPKVAVHRQICQLIAGFEAA